MARKILFQKSIRSRDGSETADADSASQLTFCGPSPKDGSYAITLDCFDCGEDLQVPLTRDELIRLHKYIATAINESFDDFCTHGISMNEICPSCQRGRKELGLL